MRDKNTASDQARTSVVAGALICIEQGEYSDYRVDGFFVALAAFSPAEELRLFLEAHPGQQGYEFKPGQFVGYLIQRGLLMAINYDTIHLCDYGSASEFEFIPFEP